MRSPDGQVVLVVAACRWPFAYQHHMLYRLLSRTHKRFVHIEWLPWADGTDAKPKWPSRSCGCDRRWRKRQAQMANADGQLTEYKICAITFQSNH